ncbi:hypothetical protein Syun_010528 [Stephania yunnanensis]|uniref:Uncharacterized protein n=1 Tax=Stephania yunnanensis TaxID=152371 RepID=A0AAP0KIS1_9MAGN
MYAEQQLNAFYLVKEKGLAVEIRLDYRLKDYSLGCGGSGVVTAEEVERGIRRVMEKDSEVRRRVKEMSVKSREAAREGGSSSVSMKQFIEDLQPLLHLFHPVPPTAGCARRSTHKNRCPLFSSPAATSLTSNPSNPTKNGKIRRYKFERNMNKARSDIIVMNGSLCVASNSVGIVIDARSLVRSLAGYTSIPN